MIPEGWYSAGFAVVAALAGMIGVAQDQVPADPGAPVVVTGQPLVHPFHPETPVPAGGPVEMVTGSWHVAAQGEQEVRFDGRLVPYGVVNPVLADDLVVEYGTVRRDGQVVWHSAGPLGHARSYAEAVGTRPVVGAGDQGVDIPVRVLLDDHPHGPVPVGAGVTVAFVVGTREDLMGSSMALRPGPGHDGGVTTSMGGL